MSSLMISPIQQVLSLREAMDRLFDESFVRPFGAMLPDGGFTLPIDVQATPDEYIIQASVPGLKSEDIHLEVVGNTVTIRGEYKDEKKVERANYLMQERRAGQFSRSLTLPTPLEASKAEAVVENGVLTVRVPKTEEAKPKAIAVKAKK